MLMLTMVSSQEWSNLELVAEARGAAYYNRSAPGKPTLDGSNTLSLLHYQSSVCVTWRLSRCTAYLDGHI